MHTMISAKTFRLIRRLAGTAAVSPAWSGWTKMPNGQFTGTTTDPTGANVMAASSRPGGVSS